MVTYHFKFENLLCIAHLKCTKTLFIRYTIKHQCNCPSVHNLCSDLTHLIKTEVPVHPTAPSNDVRDMQVQAIALSERNPKEENPKHWQRRAANQWHPSLLLLSFKVYIHVWCTWMLISLLFYVQGLSLSPTTNLVA